LEDLSASLFQSANEMVAEERRERSRLEERVKMLEGRDEAVKQRLGLLERAVERIGRVKEVLGSA
jgi:predicted nuclease with TOPRIM domain